MKLWDIIKTVGSAAIQVALPGTGSLIVGAVNALLPDDKKLPEGATGDQMGAAIAGLPPEAQASLMEKEFDVDITQIRESNATLREMLRSDAATPQSTRPYIAKGAFMVVAFTTITVISVWAFGVLSENDSLVETVMGGWQFILAVLGPLVTLLWAYFGVIRKEHGDKLNAASGTSPVGGIMSLIKGLRK